MLFYLPILFWFDSHILCVLYWLTISIMFFVTAVIFACSKLIPIIVVWKNLVAVSAVISSCIHFCAVHLLHVIKVRKQSIFYSTINRLFQSWTILFKKLSCSIILLSIWIISCFKISLHIYIILLMNICHDIWLLN